MPRRGENVYKRKDGRWEGRILKQDGKYQYFYAKAYKKVKEKMKSFQEHGGLCETQQPGKEKNAAALFTNWLEGDLRRQVKPSTYENYHYCMQRYVLPFFGRTENSKITEASVARFTKEIKDDIAISESYKKKILTIFKTALRELLRGMPESPAVMQTVRLPRAQSAEVQVFTMKEQRLIEQAALCATDSRALGILLCFYTGIRLGELCALKWSDLDREAGTLSVARTVSRTKNFAPDGTKTMLYVGTPKSRKSVRKIPLPAFLLELADAYQRTAPHGGCYVFSGGNVPPDPRTMQKLFQSILESAGVTYRKFHTIRHTFATRALELGVDIKTLSEILGHSNVSVTLNIYAHSLMDHKKTAIDKFNHMHLTHMHGPAFAVPSAV